MEVEARVLVALLVRVRLILVGGCDELGRVRVEEKVRWWWG